MPIELGSFDIILGMDWLANHHAVIVCDEKIVWIPFGDKVLIVPLARIDDLIDQLKGSRVYSKIWLSPTQSLRGRHSKDGVQDTQR
ncbi:putative reverse transcriptase domain-containing protein, partial [Tanacetum coccineum]